jgi:hypothetical protein
VVKTLSPNSSVVEFAGRLVAANSSAKLTEGQPIHVKVKSLDRPIVMQLMGEEEQEDGRSSSAELKEVLSKLNIAPGFRSLVAIKNITKGIEDLRASAIRLELWGDRSASAQTRQLVKKLTDMADGALSSFRNVRLQAEAEGIKADLKSFFIKSGYNYESLIGRITSEAMRSRSVGEDKVGAHGRASVAHGGVSSLSDLKDSFKGRLLELRSSLPPVEVLEPSPAMAQGSGEKELKEAYTDFGRSVSRLLGCIDSSQALSRLAWEESGTLYFQIPLEMSKGEENPRIGRFKVKYRQPKAKRGTTKESYHIAMLLDMPHLGRLGASVFIDRKSLSCSFTASGHEVGDFLKSHSQELSGALKGLGYNVGRLSFDVGPPQTEDGFEAEVVGREHREMNRVDLVV